jgi:hypothetical protein
MINARGTRWAKPRSSAPRPMILFAALMVGLCVGSNTAAQNADSHAPIGAAKDMALQPPERQPVTRQLVKPGDRTCLQDTGSLIPPKKGHCLPVPGRSYSREELRNTGAIDNAHALQMLDPSITGGH